MKATKRSARRGVQVPMDSDGIHPESLIAAMSVGIRTLADRSDEAGHCLDWNTLETCLHHPPATAADPDPAAMLIVRAVQI